MSKASIAADISRFLFGVTLANVGYDAALDEFAFHYALYHYAAYEILQKYGVETAVRERFPDTLSSFVGSTPLSFSFHAASGQCVGIVNHVVDTCAEEKYNPFLRDDIYKMFRMKSYAVHSWQTSSSDHFLGYEPEDSEIQNYFENTCRLRPEVKNYLLEAASKKQEPKFLGSGLSLGLFIGFVVFLIWLSAFLSK